MADDDSPASQFIRGFEAMSGQQYIIGTKEQEFELSTVQYLIKQFGLRLHTHEILDYQESMTTVRRLTLSAFNHVFPTFPFVIGSSTLCDVPLPYTSSISKKKNTGLNYLVHLDPYSTEPARYKKFDWVPFFIAYQNFYNHNMTANETRKLCLVYRRRGFVHGMCIHNDASEQYWPTGGAFVYKFTHDGRDRRVFVSPFQSLVTAIWSGGHGWRP